MALSAPQPDGDKLPPADVLGHLLLICPTEYIPAIITSYTKPGEAGDPAIRVDVAVLTQQTAEGQIPVYRGALWFNAKLYSGLKKQIGETVLARMGQGQAQPGQSAPWLLIDAMNDQQAVAFAEQWLASPAGVEFEANAAKAAIDNAGGPPPVPAAAAPAPIPAAAAPVALPAAAQVPQVPSPLAAPATNMAPAPAVPAAAQTAGAPNLAQMLAGLPAEEQQKMLAILSQQANASS